MGGPGVSGTSSGRNALIVMSKRPGAGSTKTRLCPPLSTSQAAELYECFLLDTLDLMAEVPGVRPVIAYLPAGSRDYFKGLAPDFEILLQQGADLGERLDYCMKTYLRRGFNRVVIMSSDVPNLPVEYLARAFQELEQADVVLGPCEDGGYYLIGLKQPASRLLLEVRMSTDHVTRDTLAIAREEGLQVSLLPQWYDIDDGETLLRLAADLECQSSPTAVHTCRGLARLNLSGYLKGQQRF